MLFNVHWKSALYRTDRRCGRAPTSVKWTVVLGLLWVWLKKVLGHNRLLGVRLATDAHFTAEVQERVILMKQRLSL